MNSDLFELKNARSRASAIGGGHDSNGGRITITGGTIITLVIPHIMDGTPFNVPGIGANDSICPVEISSEMQLYLGQNGVIWDPAENNEGSAPCMKVLPH